MTGVITWETILGLLGIFSLIFTMWWKIHMHVQSRNIILSRSIERVRTDLEEFKLQVARDYSTNKSMEDALSKVNRSIDRLSSRIDRILERTGNKHVN